jgi:hypothetical protein
MSLEQQMGELYEKSSTGIGNLIQANLAQMHGETFDQFLDNHADDFRKVLSNQPELLEQYDTDPAGTLKAIEDILYPQHH